MKRLLPIILILILASFLRLYQLGLVPPSASLDEASIGWNAYSIAKTGADEYGTRFPLVLRAYDDYRPALYVYLVIPFVWLFGLTTWVVRFPSVLLSIISVWIVYLTTRKLFDTEKMKETIALAASFLLAISPWHIYISRLGHEANLGLFFVIGGTYFFVKKAYLLSVISFVLSLYGYQSQKIVLPLLAIVWGIFFLKKMLREIGVGKVMGLVVVGILLAMPMLLASVSQDALLRLKHTSAFQTDDPIVVKEQSQFVQAKESGDMAGIVWHNRRIVPVKIFVSNYISHFSPRWLFTGTIHESFKVPFLGLMYPWELLFIGIGLVALLKDRKYRDASKILVPILLLSPVPAAITTMAPHAMRFYTSIPVWQIIGALGFVSLWKRVFVPLFVFLFITSVGYFCYQYFVVFPRIQSKPYQYALHKAIEYIDVKKGEYTKVIVSNDKDTSQSYMFYLFDTKYDPAKYQSLGGTVSGGFAQWHGIDNIIFRPINWEKEEASRETLFVGNRGEFGAGATIISEFPYLDGKVNVVAAQKLP